MLDTIKNIHKKYGMKSQLSMLSDFASGFPTEIYYLNCINEICEITKWKNTTLIDIINKHASIFANNLEIRLNNTKLSNKEKDTIIKNATVKFKGNILEIIVEKLCRNNMFCDRYKLNFDYVIGSDNDNGIDIMMYYRDNPDWKVGMQIKFRTFEEIDYKSGALSKTSDMVRREMEKMLIEEKISIETYLNWIKKCQTKVILVTTTDANYKLKEFMPDLEIANKDVLLSFISNNKTFWTDLQKDICVEISK